MIAGIGTDIVRIERIRSAAERWGMRFVGRIFTPGEISYCFAQKRPYASLAVRFAAKEAFIKAIRSHETVSLSEIEVMRDDAGRPGIEPRGRLRSVVNERRITAIHVSLSHEADYGVATVVIEAAG